MYDRLEDLREYISDLEIEESDKKYMINIIDELERNIEIQDGVISYFNDEDNYDY